MPLPAHAKTIAPRERVLVADDEDLVRMVLKTLLTMRGYQVLTAEDGADAVEKFRTASPRPELVLLDFHMPKLTGLQALQAMRELDPRVPAVILSGGLHESVSEGMEGVVFLHKPFENDELLRLVRELIEARGA